MSIGNQGSEICARCGTKFEVDNYCENGHCRPVGNRPLNKRDFPLGGDFDPDEPYREYCKDEPSP